MPIYRLILAFKHHDAGNCPNIPGFKAYASKMGFVIRANTTKHARMIAAKAVDGGRWWNDPKETLCQLITVDGKPRVILSDNPTG